MRHVHSRTRPASRARAPGRPVSACLGDDGAARADSPGRHIAAASRLPGPRPAGAQARPGGRPAGAQARPGQARRGPGPRPRGGRPARAQARQGAGPPASRRAGASACHRTVAGAARWHIRRRGGPHDGACERPARDARLGDEPGTCSAPWAGDIHRSTNMCSNQDGFPCGTYVCSNNLHVSGKLWPLASIRCYSLVPSKRPDRPSGNARPTRDLPRPASWLGGVAPGHRAGTAPVGRTVVAAGHRRCAVAGSRRCAASEHRPGSAGRASSRRRGRAAATKVLSHPAEQAARGGRRQREATAGQSPGALLSHNNVTHFLADSPARAKCQKVRRENRFR